MLSFVTVLVLILSVSFVSAGFFDDLFGKGITGNTVVDEDSCSGCMVPEFFGKSGDACVLEGSRMSFNASENVKVYEKNDYSDGRDYALDVFPDGKAIILVYFDGNVGIAHDFIEGEEVDVQFENSGAYKLMVNKVNYFEEDNPANYVTVDVLEGYDSYCNSNGNIDAQKDIGGECKSHYQCLSNVCSSGFCIESSELKKSGSIFIDMANLFRGLFS